MENGLQHSGFDDPFQHCSLLALLPRTLGTSFNPATIASEAHELGSIQNLFNSMALKATTELLEQAHTISKSYSNLPILCSKDGNKASSPNGKDHPQGRRPALGRKRAQFSLKPMSSHVLPSIDHIEDPEEYFLAFEQREHAERELKKLRGEDTKALTQHHQSTTAARKRRPGLLGKTTSYKHHFPANNAYSAEAFLESQELPSTGILSPSKTSSGMELDTALHSGTIDAPGSSRAKKTDGSAVDKEKNADNLSKILRSFEDLDEGEGRILLQETLQLKQIDVGKICLPELGSIQTAGGSLFNNKIAGGKSECPQFDQDTPSLSKSPLAAISTLQRLVSLKDPLEAFYSLPPSDASSSSRDSSQSKRTDGDSISPADTTYSNKSRLKGDGASSLVMQNGKRLSFEHEMQAPVLEADRTSGNKVILEEEFREHTSCLLDKNIDHNSSSHDTSKEVIRAVPDNRLQEKAPNSQDSSPSKSQDRDSVALTHVNANESLIRDNASVSSLGMEKTSYIEDKMRSPVVEAARTTGGMITSEELTGQHCLLENYTNQNCRRGDNTNDFFSGLNGSLQEVRISQLEPLITGGPGAAVEDLIAGSSRTEHFSSSPSRKTGLHCSTSEINADTSLFGPDNNLQIEVNAWAQKRVATVEPSKETSCIPEVTTSVDGPLENTFVLAEESNEGHRTASVAPLSKGVTKKVPPHRRNKKKEFSRRQSLAGAGLKWKAGVRRSSRIRSRPLQYWLGERFLYGRIHDSLATVIGVKYASPAKEGKGPVLKVKSYVPEEYSDLVAQAALH